MIKKLFTTLVVTALVTQLIKIATALPRPIHGQWCPFDYTFPSLHSSLAFAAATLFTLIDTKRAWLYYLLAATIGYSRILLGCHYVGDVIAGALLGIILALIIAKIDHSHISHGKSHRA